VLPEIAVDVRRAARTHAIARYSGSHAVAIGYDCIPITSAETAGGGMPGGFANYLAALAEFAVVAPISQSSGTEFDGWRGMLGGAGLAGPRIHTVDLATTADAGDGSNDDALLKAVGVASGETVVLAVGSHEPRKNHLALLQAAELAWRRGEAFALVMVGGNSWDTAEFDRALAAAAARGRRIILLSAAPDATVWALYRRARFTVFPSLNEGFGLPVVESISVGTPVITSNFGSMRESADGYGGLLVDPRDDEALADSIVTLLTDDALIGRLRKQTTRAPVRNWERYATELWSAFAPETRDGETT
jgi:glycosyltransferase involved in cell wall biosynthesis